MSERPSAEILDMLFDVIDSKRNDGPETKAVIIKSKGLLF